MASQFGYYRPRGVLGNYIVLVTLDLAETETGEVYVERVRNHHCGTCGKQQPVKVHLQPNSGVSSRKEYVITDIVAGDRLTIEIKDQWVMPFQQTRHTATMEGFYHELIPFEHNGNIWEGETQVRLNPIYLLDQDCSSKPFAVLPRKRQAALGQPSVRVREVPNQALQIPQSVHEQARVLQEFFGGDVSIQSTDQGWWYTLRNVR